MTLIVMTLDLLRKEVHLSKKKSNNKIKIHKKSLIFIYKNKTEILKSLRNKN